MDDAGIPEVRRPEPNQGWRQQARDRVTGWRSRLATQRELRDRQASTVDPPVVGGDVRWGRRESPLALAFVAIGSAALTLGAFFGWQTWSQRSATPIDDLLPVLVGVDPSAQAETEDTSSPTEETEAVPRTSAVAMPEEPVATETPNPRPTSMAAPANIVVHVSGAVHAPGVVELEADSRVFQAVALAGDATDDAELDRVNLAAPLVDGERIHIPSQGEDEPPRLVPPDRPVAAADSATVTDSRSDEPETPILVDLNQAGPVMLQTLPGVGPATADAIVRTRNDRGPFRSVDELLEVPGIGETKLEQLRPFLIVSPIE